MDPESPHFSPFVRSGADVRLDLQVLPFVAFSCIQTARQSLAPRHVPVRHESTLLPAAGRIDDGDGVAAVADDGGRTASTGQRNGRLAEDNRRDSPQQLQNDSQSHQHACSGRLGLVLKMEISSRIPIPLSRPELVQSGSASFLPIPLPSNIDIIAYDEQ